MRERNLYWILEKKIDVELNSPTNCKHVTKEGKAIYENPILFHKICCPKLLSEFPGVSEDVSENAEI